MRMLANLLAIFALTLPVAAQQKLAFDVASIRENKSVAGPGGEQPSTNVPLGPGNVYSPTGGQLNIRNTGLLLLVSFAYRMSIPQQDAFRDMAPTWVTEERFDIQARTDKTDVTKDELRLMMRSLLADRFGLVVHNETRTAPVYSMQLLKADTLGPHFRKHTGACSKDFKGKTTVDADADGYPEVCGGLLLLSGSASTHFRIGARDMPITVFATSLTGWGDLGRPVINDTGIKDNIDFVLDFVPPYAQAAAGADVDGQGFQEALRKQLGLKLEAQKQPVEMMVLDHIDHLSEN
ncbi:TIGR03435 family protein [Terriglobus roseus]|uniref:Soil-associated protein, TIGR03435 family n=1 Tax=Terriglobus roseus TaxID=392734 RepID=A0A1G7FW61_9BACT|nr:TIGR03435 family protein [Terriglobus roseus]SDE80133.1 soil-associated protein, TIGR03435 family [Terriglobus roseus]